MPDSYNTQYLKEMSSAGELRWKANERSKRSFRKKRNLILWLLGNKCVHCGFSDPRALQIDHVHGEANKNGRLQGSAYYREILESIEQGEEKYQLLCANCNWIKRVENKECYKRIRTPKNPSFKERS